MDADGADPRRLADGWDPVCSPDGNRIAYKEWDDPVGVWVMDADGADPRRLADGWDPVWSPDGDGIANNNGGIWMMDADGANHRLVAGTRPAWSSDGSRPRRAATDSRAHSRLDRTLN